MRHTNLLAQASAIIIAVLASGCPIVPCEDEPGQIGCYFNGGPCTAADDGVDGEQVATCSPAFQADPYGQHFACGPDLDDSIELMTDDAAELYGATDYALESASHSLVGLLDRQKPPVDVDESGTPWDDPENIMRALPGVVAYEGPSGLDEVAYLSRVCCPQAVEEGSLPGFPQNVDCQLAGPLLNDTPAGWCLDIPIDDVGGLCVFPCATDDDCPLPFAEFCDLSVPDPNPNSNAPGVCRYKSMPFLPTTLEEIIP